ncbi:Endonuclease NucS [uncultured archaeon]|nr:Endonuclease NucS [uncultured archaeon]
MEIRKAYDSDIIYTDTDVVLIGDPKKSYDIRKAPLILDKYILSRLDLNGKPIKWDIVDKKGIKYDEKKCITTCLRPPRVLSESDGDMLEQLVSERHQKLTSNTKFNNFLPINSLVATKIHFECKTEREIEDIVIRNIESLENGLKHIDRQVILIDGNRVDILAQDSDSTPVLIEVKKGIADDSTLAQVASYLHQYKKQYPSTHPIGKIVCADASYKLKNACEHLGVKIHFYGEILKCEKDKYDINSKPVV